LPACSDHRQTACVDCSLLLLWWTFI